MVFYERIQDVSWQAQFNDLKAYKEEHGHLDVPYDYVSRRGFKLGSWVRRMRHATKLTAIQRSRLEALGFQVAAPRTIWEQGCQYLEEYKVEYGDCWVPQKYVTADGFSLGQFVMKNRDLYRQRELTKSQVSHLEELQPGLVTCDLRKERWNR